MRNTELGPQVEHYVSWTKILEIVEEPALYKNKTFFQMPEKMEHLGFHFGIV